MMTKTKLLLSAAAASVLVLNGCGGGGGSTPSNDNNDTDPQPTALDCSTVTYTTPGDTTLPASITSHTKLTADQTWILDGRVAVTNETCLMIEPGTTIAGKSGTGDNTSYLVIDKDSKIDAQGTSANPIIFTSEVAANGGTGAAGQWGGVTLIGNAANAQVGPYEADTEFVPGDSDMADNSGIMTHVQVLNTGIAIRENEEVNGLSFVGVGSGTTVNNITVDRAGDDGIELWGGTVNLSNISISGALDDSFDIDDGYSGTVTNLTIDVDAAGKAAIEMSGTTVATFEGLDITISANQEKEGGIYFKNDGIGGHFTDVTITNNGASADGAIHSAGTADTANISFENVVIDDNSAADTFTGDSAAALQTLFNNGTGNSIN